MFSMFSQLFAMISMFFASGEKLGKATNHLATWAEESAAAFADEARVLRKSKLNALNLEHKTEVTATE